MPILKSSPLPISKVASYGADVYYTSIDKASSCNYTIFFESSFIYMSSPSVDPVIKKLGCYHVA